MPDKKRFIRTSSRAGVWFIKDMRDESLVAILIKGSRPIEHTQAMAQIMLDALNRAVEKTHGNQ